MHAEDNVTSVKTNSGVPGHHSNDLPALAQPEKIRFHGQLPAQGLYDPANEHDACGVGFIANLKGGKTHDIITKGLEILVNLTHRGAVGADPSAGDGAGWPAMPRARR